MPGFGKTCQVCTHPNRAAIEASLATLPSVIQVSKVHPEVSRDSLYRHIKAGHIGAAQASALDRLTPNSAAHPGTVRSLGIGVIGALSPSLGKSDLHRGRKPRGGPYALE